MWTIRIIMGCIVIKIVWKITGVNVPTWYNATHNYVNSPRNSSRLKNCRCESSLNLEINYQRWWRRSRSGKDPSAGEWGGEWTSWRVKDKWSLWGLQYFFCFWSVIFEITKRHCAWDIKHANRERQSYLLSVLLAPLAPLALLSAALAGVTGTPLSSPELFPSSSASSASVLSCDDPCFPEFRSLTLFSKLA